MCFHGFVLFPQSYHPLWFRQSCALSTCEHMQGHQAPSCHRKNPLPAVISDKATAWDKSCGTQLQDPAPSWTVMRPEHLVGKRKRRFQSKVRNSESLREGTPNTLPLLVQLCPSDTREHPGVLGGSPYPEPSSDGHLLSLPAPCGFDHCVGRAVGFLVGFLKAGDPSGTPHFDPDLARNGLIWSKALACGNEGTELILGQVLHLPPGKLSVLWATAIPELAEGPPACPMLQTHHLPCWTSLQSPFVSSVI